MTKAQNRIIKEKEEEALALGLRSEAEKKKQQGGKVRRQAKEKARLAAIEAGAKPTEMTREEREEMMAKKAKSCGLVG